MNIFAFSIIYCFSSVFSAFSVVQMIFMNLSGYVSLPHLLFSSLFLLFQAKIPFNQKRSRNKNRRISTDNNTDQHCK